MSQPLLLTESLSSFHSPASRRLDRTKTTSVIADPQIVAANQPLALKLHVARTSSRSGWVKRLKNYLPGFALLVYALANHLVYILESYQ